MDRTTIAVTGGIGTGKSSVCRFLAAFCCVPVIDIDVLCHQLVEKGNPGWQALFDLLGSDYFDRNNDLDRSKRRCDIFSDSALRKKVDATLHPLVREKMLALKCACTSPLLFVDIPLLYEAGLQNDFNKVIVVYADEDVQYRRVVKRDGVSLEQAKASVASQMSLKKKMELADYLIDNSHTWKEARSSIIELAEKLEKENV